MTQQSDATPASSNSDNPERSPSAQQTQMATPPVKPAKPEKINKPVKNLYEPYNTPMWFYKALRLMAHCVFFLIFNVRLVGRENVPKQGAFMAAANHLSWTDVPLVPTYLKGKVVYMAKEELFYSKIGWVVRFLGAFPVKRGEADRQSLRAADQQLKAGKIFTIFPEGTRSKNHQLGQAHVGLGMIALRSGFPVLPIAIWGTENSFKKFRPRITISFGEPLLLTPRGKKITREDIDDATTEVMRHIAAMMPPQYRGMYGDEPTKPTDEL